MAIKLHDSELKIMDILWKEGDTTAKRLAEVLGEQVGWTKATTYTLIRRCIQKGAIQRLEPNFLCRALAAREEAQALETDELLNKLYDGAPDQLIASLLGRKKHLGEKEVERLMKLIDELEQAAGK